MLWLRNFSAVFFALVLSSCGFRPLYLGSGGENALAGHALESELARVFVNEIPTRYGQLLRHRILDNIAPKGNPDNPRFILEVSLPELFEEQQGIRSDNIATRVTLTYVAKYSLRNRTDNALIMTDSTSAMGSYNIVDSPYATQTAEQALKERLINILGDDISLRLSVYLRNHPKLSQQGEETEPVKTEENE